MSVPRQRIKEYYERVKRILKETRKWDYVVSKFPEGELAVYRAVTIILERLAEVGVDPQTFDWKAAFVKLEDYDSIDSFIEALEEEGVLPTPTITELGASEEAFIAREASRLEGQIMSLIEEAKDVRPEILKRVRERIAEALGQVEDIDRLYLEVSRLKEEARRERAKAREYKAKTQELEKELRKLYEEISALRQQLEEAKKAQKRYVYKMVALKAVTHIPSFLGEDGKVYGPFEAGQIFNVPERDAHKLISRGLAQPWKPTAFPPEAPKPPKKEINPEIKVKTDTLWEQYVNAVLSHEPIVAMEAARQLREFRKKLFA